MKFPSMLRNASILAVALVGLTFSARAEDEKKVAVTGNDQMKYDVLAIDAAAGQKLTITIKNGGQLPKTAMAHNLVILKPGTDVSAFATACMSHAAESYIAPDQSDKILAQSKLLGPGESDTVSVTLPAAGTYDYICTFPAHAMVGMHGVITVK